MRGVRGPVNRRAGAPRSGRRRATGGRRSAGGPGWRSCASGTAQPGPRSTRPLLRSPGGAGGRSASAPVAPLPSSTHRYHHLQLVLPRVAEALAFRVHQVRATCPNPVTKLRDRGLVETKVDPSDKRRTLVRVSGKHRRTAAQKGAVPVDPAVTEALGEAQADASKGGASSTGSSASSEPGSAG